MSFDICIIGAGPVGIFSAFQAGMLGMTSCVVDALSFPGGQCAALYPEKLIYDIPAYPAITGQGLIDNLMKQAKRFDPKYILEQKIIRIDRDSKSGFEVVTSHLNSGVESKISAKVVLICSGSGLFAPKKPPIEGIEEFENKNIFYFVDKVSRFEKLDIVIAGGGDSAVDWAITLCNTAKNVYMIHRRPEFRCLPESKKILDKLVEDGKIKLVTPYQVSGIRKVGNEFRGIEIENFDDQSKKVIECDAFLPFFGLHANTDTITSPVLELHKKLISVDHLTMKSSVDGIYAVGDCAHYETKKKLIMLGFAESSLALHDAYSVVFPEKAFHFQHSSSIFG